MPEKTSRSKNKDPYPAHYWERVWFDLAARNWRSLSLVSAQEGTQTLEAANALRDVAAMYNDRTVMVVDGSHATPHDLQGVQDVVADGLWAGDRVIIALGDPMTHAATIPLARSTDASALCVVLTDASLQHTRTVVRTIGESRFIGTVALDP